MIVLFPKIHLVICGWRRALPTLFVVMLLALPTASAAQSLERLHILNAGINLGWVSGIVETEGVTPANIAEIGIDLANATAAISALVPLIADPPYDSSTFVEVNKSIAELSARIGGMTKTQAEAEIGRIQSRMTSALRVFLSGRTGTLQIGGTCDSATFEAAYHFGRGHTAIQRGNLALERSARQTYFHRVHTGREIAASNPCEFPSDAYLSAPFLPDPTPATYAATLAVIQTVAVSGDLPAGVAVSPATSVVTVTPGASALPSGESASGGNDWVLGAWSYVNNPGKGGEFRDVHTFLPGGEMEPSGGRWRVADGTLIVTWPNGYTNRYAISGGTGSLRGVTVAPNGRESESLLMPQ